MSASTSTCTSAWPILGQALCQLSSPSSLPTSQLSVHRWTSPWDLPSSVCTAGPQPGSCPAQCAPLDLNQGPSQLSVHRWTSTWDLPSSVCTAGPQRPDRMPEDMPDRMSDRMPEDMPEDMPDRMPEDMSDRMPEDLPVRKSINVMVGITRSKVILHFFVFSIYIFLFFLLLAWKKGKTKKTNLKSKINAKKMQMDNSIFPPFCRSLFFPFFPLILLLCFLDFADLFFGYFLFFVFRSFFASFKKKWISYGLADIIIAYSPMTKKL